MEPEVGEMRQLGKTDENRIGEICGGGGRSVDFSVVVNWWFINIA